MREIKPKAEGVDNTSFEQGDDTHLDFADENFDAVTSNYVYHNIPSSDRQEIVMNKLIILLQGYTMYIQRRYCLCKLK